MARARVSGATDPHALAAAQVGHPGMLPGDGAIPYPMSGRIVMLHWLRRLFQRRPASGGPGVGARETEWMKRSAVPTEADEDARQRAEERRGPSEPDTS